MSMEDMVADMRRRFLVAALSFADLSLLSLGNWWTVADSARYSTLAGFLWVPVVVLVAVILRACSAFAPS